MPNKSGKEVVGDFIDNCTEIVWVEEEVEKWSTIQAKRYLAQVDDDRASYYKQRAWMSYLKSRFHNNQIDRPGEELSVLMGERGEHWIPWTTRCFPQRMGIYPLGKVCSG